jgi:hypothetical protein
VERSRRGRDETGARLGFLHGLDRLRDAQEIREEPCGPSGAGFGVPHVASRARRRVHRIQSIDPLKRTAGCGEGIDPAFDLRIIDQRRCMVRLDPSVDDQGPGAAPVFLVDE